MEAGCLQFLPSVVSTSCGQRLFNVVSNNARTRAQQRPHAPPCRHIAMLRPSSVRTPSGLPPSTTAAAARLGICVSGRCQALQKLRRPSFRGERTRHPHLHHRAPTADGRLRRSGVSCMRSLRGTVLICFTDCQITRRVETFSASSCAVSRGSGRPWARADGGPGSSGVRFRQLVQDFVNEHLAALREACRDEDAWADPLHAALGGSSILGRPTTSVNRGVTFTRSSDSLFGNQHLSACTRVCSLVHERPKPRAPMWLNYGC